MAWSQLELYSLGGINGLYQVVGDATKGYRKIFQKYMRINTDCWSYHLFQGFVTFVLVDFSWLFFRANGFSVAWHMLERIWTELDPLSILDPQTLIGINTMIMPEKDFYVMLLALVILMLVEYFRERIDLKAALARQNIWFRYLVYYLLIFTILIFGVYGPEYDASSFIYFQF